MNAFEGMTHSGTDVRTTRGTLTVAEMISSGAYHLVRAVERVVRAKR